VSEYDNSKKEIRIGDYLLEPKGSNVIIYDKNGTPVYVIKAKSLSSYKIKKDLAKKLNVDEACVDRGVAQLVARMHKAKINPSPTPMQTAPELAKKAMDLLEDPKILFKIETAFREQGLVGETKNAFSTFFDMLSALTEEPINRRWSARAGVGKSAIVTKVAQLFPPEMIIVRSGLTKKAIWHMPGSEEIDENTRMLDLRHKVLVLLEESESREFLDEAKPLLSHDMPELKYEFTVNEGGKLITYVQMLKGWPAYVGVTTVPETREEQQTRALIGSPDRGEEKYKAVISADAERAALPWKNPKVVWTPIIQEAIRQLKPVKVWIPWLQIVAEAFPSKQAKAMREWRFFHSFMESIALLFQYQLPSITFNGEEYIIALPFILELAILIGEAAFVETMSGLEKDVHEFIEYLRTKGSGPWTYKELLREYENCFGESIGETTLRRRYTNKLLDMGLLELDDAKKPYKLSLCRKSSIFSSDFQKILEKVKSDETKRILKLKISSTNNQSTLPTIYSYRSNCGKLPIPWEDFWECIYTGIFDMEEDVKSLFKKSKSQEYPKKSFSIGLEEKVDDFGENKSNLSYSTSVNETPQKMGNERLLEGEQHTQASVTSLKDIKSIYRSYKPRDQYKCGFCGYKKPIDQKAKTFRGEELWICDDCCKKLLKVGKKLSEKT
jgi:predicted SprT family Zn-dependent metalloprotease